MNIHTRMIHILAGMIVILANTAMGAPRPWFVQEHYRWRNDDGSETSATWKSRADTPITGVTRGANIRLRFCVANTGSAGGSIAPRLQYSTNPTGTWWTAVSTVQNGLTPFEMTDSLNYTNGQLTTEQLFGSGTFVMGRMVEYPKNMADSVGLGPLQYSNFEYCFRATAKAQGNTTYYFKASGCNTNLQYAQLTIEPGEANEPPVIVSSLSVTGMISAPFTYTIQASGTEPITYNATNLPSGLGFDGVNSITGVMPDSAGTYLIELSATNAYGSDSKTLSLTAVETGGGGIIIPNDPLFDQLWGMHNTGQSNGVVDADIDAPEAWAIHTGTSNVLVGVIDTGIDYTHPDLASNYWTNPGETGLDAQGRDKRTNGIDDDGNGYIDDWRGWNFINETNDPKDDHFHGTHCAGTIGGIGNNTVGVAGVCWNVSLVALKFIGSGGSGYISDAVEATAYATRIRCALTSNSWGGGGYSQAMVDAIEEAHTNGILFVAAAGNNGANADLSPMYPAAYDNLNIISVAATTRTDEKASFSNYGATSVDLGAPGHEILSTYPTYMTDAMLKYGHPTNYNSISGTSMATPHVAGACALLKSFDPTISHMEIKTYLMRSSDVIPALQGKTVSGGRLNIYRALKWRQEGRSLLIIDNVAIDDGTLPGTSGNTNGVADVGETVALLVSLKNPGTNESLSGSIQLEGIGNQYGINIISNSVNFAPIPGTSTVEVRFTVEFLATYETTYDAKFLLTVQESDESSWNESITINVHYTPPSYGAFFWGYGSPSGNPVIQQSTAPAPIWRTYDGVESIASASFSGHCLAIKTNGTLWAWGDGTYGQLGLGTNYQSVSVPTQIPGLSNVVASAVGLCHSLALLSDGTVWAWGLNAYGQLGLGTTNSEWTPVQIPTLSNICAISAGGYFSVAVDTDGSVWSWGDNAYGQLGNGTTNLSLVPIKLSTITGVSTVSAGRDYTLALKTNGTVWAWGYNKHAQLGDGSRTHRNSPVQTSGLTNVSRISASDRHSLAVKSDGTVWGWGEDYHGEASGQSGNLYRETPVQVSGISGVANVAGGHFHSVALKTNGTVWAWGSNNFGQLGNGSLFISYSPVQVLPLSNAVGVSAQSFASIAWLSGTGQPSTNSAPVIVGGSLYTQEDTPVRCTYMAYDPDGDQLTYQITLMPQHGTVTGVPPDMVYTPDTNYYGFDEFRYKASDGEHDSNEAIITVTVNPVNDTPIIVSGPTATPSNATVGETIQFSVEVMDVEGHQLSYLWDFQDGTTDTNASPTHAYEANGNFMVSVVIDDGCRNGLTTGTVAVTVTGGTNWAPVASNDTYTLNEDIPLEVSAPGVLSNDTDADNDPLNAILVTSPTNGSLVLNMEGSFTYTPSNNYYGTDRFVYRVNDGKTDGNLGVVDLTILPVNDAPIASNMVLTTAEDKAKVFYLLASDVETSYYSLTFTIVRGPTNGTITPGTFYYRAYTPNTNYNGHDSFTFKVNDGELDSNIATVDIIINSVNDAPTVTISNSPSAGMLPLAVAFTANGSDVDGDPLTYSWTFGDGATSTNQNPIHTYTKMGLYTASVTVRDISNATATAGTNITVRMPPELVGYWALNDGEGTNAVDLAITNNGLVSGAVWTQGVHETGLWFDGTNDSVTISAQPYGGIDDNNFTMSVWVDPTAGRASTPESTSGIVGTSNQRYVIFPVPRGDTAYGSGHAGVAISVGTNGISVFEYAASYIPSVLVTNISVSGWTHIVVVYSNHVPKLYVNGEFIKNGQVSSKVVHPGCSMGGSSYGWYQGWADDVRIYNYALSPWQVRVLAEGDWDGDWMPDAWEINYFGGTNVVNGGANEDWDGDRMKNLDEYLAGTVPTNAESLLVITGWDIVDTTNMVLRWLSVPNKFYSIHGSSNLIERFPVITTGGLQATPPVNVHTIRIDQGVLRGFYRVGVEP